MHFFALLFPLLLATAFGSPALAERKVNNGPYEYATPFSPFSRPLIPTRKAITKDCLVELPFIHRRTMSRAAHRRTYSFFTAFRAPSFLHIYTKTHTFPLPQLVQAVTNYQEVHGTLTIDPARGIPSGKSPNSNVFKHKTASASTASKTEIKFCQIFADKQCFIFSNGNFLGGFTTSKSKLIVGRCSALDEFGILGCDTNDVFAFKSILK